LQTDLLNKFKKLKRMNNKIVAPIFIFLLLSVIRFTGLQGFTPMIAFTFFAGAIGMSWRGSVLVPLAGLLMGDILMALTSDPSYIAYLKQGEFLGIYAIYIVCAFTGHLFSNRLNVKTIALGSITSILLFFLVSNLMVWAAGLDINSHPYSKDFAGLLYCYTSALPFLLKSFIGNGAATIILFGAYAWASKNSLVAKKA